MRETPAVGFVADDDIGALTSAPALAASGEVTLPRTPFGPRSTAQRFGLRRHALSRVNAERLGILLQVLFALSLLPTLLHALALGATTGLMVFAVAVTLVNALAVRCIRRTIPLWRTTGLHAWACALGALTTIVFVPFVAFWQHETALSRRHVFALAVTLFCTSLLSELVIESLARNYRMLFVGVTAETWELVEQLHARSGLDCVGVVGTAREEQDGLPWLAHETDLESLIAQAGVDVVVLTDSAIDAGVARRLIVGPSRASVVGVRELYEHAFGRVPPSCLKPSWFMSIQHLYRRPYSACSKRVFDIVVACALLLVALPVALAIVAAMLLEGQRSIIYRQVRVGEGGRPFSIFKFRTMKLLSEVDGVPVWAQQDDPRVTRVGRILRRWRLDELPQLVNVLRGAMSMVGPRPERPELVDLLALNIPDWAERTFLKPGLTGWAQVNSGYASSLSEAQLKLSYDLYYLRHRSLWLDLLILAKTPAVLLRGSGAR
jgi:exopolysaccharide biosynthesis polyprenyl glycosylphosphotransferase